MLQNLTKKFQDAFAFIGKGKTLNEKNLSEAIRSVRLALLDADVQYGIVSQFIKKVKEDALGKQLLKSVKPKEQFVKIVHDALQDLMGSEERSLQFSSRPSGILLCGLQGSGKTTHVAKIAYFLQKQKKKKVLVAACDLERPAAILQLEKLCKENSISVFSNHNTKNPVEVAKQAWGHAFREKFDVVLFDTAGRLHIDQDLMDQLSSIKNAVNPKEVLFVVDAAQGQNAAKTAKRFDETVSITGSILTKMDGNARAGAALSICEMTKKPIIFEGRGEEISSLRPFHPKSMADRILGMGDIVNLVRQAEGLFDEEEKKTMEEKIRKASFTYEDYLQQMRAIKKMGPMKSLLRMLPGASDMADIDTSSAQMAQMEAMVLSMTLEERQEKVPLSASRQERISRGSGVSILTIKQMVTKFKKMKQVFRKLPKNFRGMDSLGIEKIMGKKQWH